jgi:hypothetical protein
MRITKSQLRKIIINEVEGFASIRDAAPNAPPTARQLRVNRSYQPDDLVYIDLGKLNGSGAGSKILCSVKEGDDGRLFAVLDDVGPETGGVVKDFIRELEEDGIALDEAAENKAITRAR